jgi:uncharacterized membrane protein YhaH (DUF805 family)
MRAAVFSNILKDNGTQNRKQFWTRLGYLTPLIFGLLFVDEVALALTIIHYQIESLSVWLAILVVPELPVVFYLFVMFRRRGNDIGIPSCFAVIASLCWPLFSLAPLFVSIGISSINENPPLSIATLLCASAFPIGVLVFGLMPGKESRGAGRTFATRAAIRASARVDGDQAELHNA